MYRPFKKLVEVKIPCVVCSFEIIVMEKPQMITVLSFIIQKVSKIPIFINQKGRGIGTHLFLLFKN